MTAYGPPPGPASGPPSGAPSGPAPAAPPAPAPTPPPPPPPSGGSYGPPPSSSDYPPPPPPGYGPQPGAGYRPQQAPGYPPPQGAAYAPQQGDGYGQPQRKARIDPKSVNPLDWVVLGTALLALIFSFFAFYTYNAKAIVVSQGCSQLSQAPASSQRTALSNLCSGDSYSAWHGFFGWFGVLLALVGAVLIALAIFSPPPALPFPARLVGAALYALGFVCVLLALFVIPRWPAGVQFRISAGDYSSAIDEGHGLSYWIVLLLLLIGAGLAFLRFQQTGGTLPGLSPTSGRRTSAPPPAGGQVGDGWGTPTPQFPLQEAATGYGPPTEYGPSTEYGQPPEAGRHAERSEPVPDEAADAPAVQSRPQDEQPGQPEPEQPQYEQHTQQYELPPYGQQPPLPGSGQPLEPGQQPAPGCPPPPPGYPPPPPPPQQ